MAGHECGHSGMMDEREKGPRGQPFRSKVNDQEWQPNTCL